jgi:hypothetical protein
MMAGHVDGNRLAGQFLEWGLADPTTTRSICAHCGDTAVLADALVFGDPSSEVVRCRSCQTVLLVVIDSPDSRRVILHEVTWWSQRPDASPL